MQTQYVKAYNFNSLNHKVCLQAPIKNVSLQMIKQLRTVAHISTDNCNFFKVRSDKQTWGAETLLTILYFLHKYSVLYKV